MTKCLHFHKLVGKRFQGMCARIRERIMWEPEKARKLNFKQTTGNQFKTALMDVST